jgi:hypothetical protein
VQLHLHMLLFFYFIFGVMITKCLLLFLRKFAGRIYFRTYSNGGNPGAATYHCTMSPFAMITKC